MNTNWVNKGPAIPKYLWWIGLSFFALITSVVVFLSGEEILLRASGKVSVSSPAEADATSRPAIATLEPGHEVPVVSCKSTKSDIELHVRLSSGQIGIVTRGEYRLEGRPLSLGSLLSPSKIVLSCSGTMLPISDFRPSN